MDALKRGKIRRYGMDWENIRFLLFFLIFLDFATQQDITAPNGKYALVHSLEDGLQDAYFHVLMNQAAANPWQPIRSETQIWGDFVPLIRPS